MAEPWQCSRLRAAFLRAAFTTARLAALALCISCSARVAPLPAQDPDPERARAALATLRVDNHTTDRIAILYRHAGRTGEVGVGHVDAGDSADMAPVPAGEPLILVARTAAGAELVLAPRTFVIDSAWTWSIERGSRFIHPDTGTT
jgi:hypothetical protein